MKNLETKQKIFDKVVKHLFKQKVCAFKNGTCRYKDDSGLRCAVGCLIPYNRMKGFNPEGNIERLIDHTDIFLSSKPKNETAKEFLKFLKKNHDLLEELQKCHDYHNGNKNKKFNLSELKDQLIRIRMNYNLKYKHLTELTKEYK